MTTAAGGRADLRPRSAPRGPDVTPEELAACLTGSLVWRELESSAAEGCAEPPVPAPPPDDRRGSGSGSADWTPTETAVALRAVALHEAAHALAFHRLGMGVSRIRVEVHEGGAVRGRAETRRRLTRRGAPLWARALLAGVATDALLEHRLAQALGRAPDFDGVARRNAKGREADLPAVFGLRAEYGVDVERELLAAARLVVEPLARVAVARVAMLVIDTAGHDVPGRTVERMLRRAHEPWSRAGTR